MHASMDGQEAPYEALTEMSAQMGPLTTDQATTCPMPPAASVLMNRVDSGARSTSLQPRFAVWERAGVSTVISVHVVWLTVNVLIVL